VIEIGLEESVTSTAVRPSVRRWSSDHFLAMLAAVSATVRVTTFWLEVRSEAYAAAARMMERW
jgi:hypothetical protein